MWAFPHKKGQRFLSHVKSFLTFQSWVCFKLSHFRWVKPKRQIRWRRSQRRNRLEWGMRWKWHSKWNLLHIWRMQFQRQVKLIIQIFYHESHILNCIRRIQYCELRLRIWRLLRLWETWGCQIPIIYVFAFSFPRMWVNCQRELYILDSKQHHLCDGQCVYIHHLQMLKWHMQDTIWFQCKKIQTF